MIKVLPLLQDRLQLSRNRNGTRRNSGQAIVLVALSMIVLLAMIGLTIDGGNLYQQRRHMQNAADAAAFAGARLLGAGVTADRYIRQEIETYAVYNKVIDPTNNVAAYYADISGNRISSVTNGVGNLAPASAVAVEVVCQRTVPTYFLGVVRINTFRVSALAAAKARNASGGGGGYAIFAIDENRPSGTKIIDWTGGGWNVTGIVHSNSDVNMSGTGNTINGMVENVTGVSPSGLSGKATLTPSSNNPVQSTVMPDPVNKTLADFYQGTTSTSTYHYVDMGGGTSNLSTFVRTTATGEKYLEAGVYYVNGNVNFSTGLSTTVPSNVTIVTTGYMVMSTPSMNFTPYTNGITFFANANNSTAPGKIALNVSGSNGTWKGILYAPNSGLRMSGSSNTSVDGGLVGDHVILTGSSLALSYNPQYWPAVPQAEIILYK